MEKTKLVTIQRSKGYATRPTLSVKRIGELIAFVKSIKPDVICMVDNCYGEFVEDTEPIQVGADMMVGSLIEKIREADLHQSEAILSAKRNVLKMPHTVSHLRGLARRLELHSESFSHFIRAFFLAPTVVSGALKGAIFAAKSMKS